MSTPTKENTDTFNVRESHLRSVVKSIIYRILSIIGTGILSWIVTRDIGDMISITFSVQLFLIILYYFYERIWSKIDWERQIEVTSCSEKKMNSDK
jgi:uncharacterized membrane protein